MRLQKIPYCRPVVSFGMGSLENLIWSRIVRTRFDRWLDEPVFALAEMDLNDMPQDPVTLQFAEKIPVKVLMEVPGEKLVLSALRGMFPSSEHPVSRFMPDNSPSPTPRDPSSLHCRILEAVSLIEEALCRGVSSSPWRSGGNPGLSLLTEGGCGGELRLVLGTAGAGKTSLAASLISGLFKQERVDPIAWFSLQETAAQAALRLLCLAARMPMARVVAGDVSTRHNLQILTKAAHALSKQPVFMDEASPMPVVELRSRCLKWAEQSRLQLIVIDPIEALLDEQGNRWGSSQQASEDITAILRVMARELGIPVLCFATSPPEAVAASLTPSLASLPESLAPILEEADWVLYLKTPKIHPGEGVVISALHLVKQDEECMPAITPLLFRPDLLFFEGVE